MLEAWGSMGTVLLLPLVRQGGGRPCEKILCLPAIAIKY